jgi:choline dehydrogenase-like flavoprotein
MPAAHDYDVIIIGTGAGGGTLAHRLAPSGKRILLLERGSFLPREKENWDPQAVFTRQRYQAKETWYDRDDQPFSPYTHYWVGGNTKMYGAALLRMRESDFQQVRHFGGVSPAWPIRYADLEPYYTEAERLYSVHGDRGADPTEPPAQGPFPYPALPYEPRMAELAEDLRRLGCRPFPCPLGVRLEQQNRSMSPYVLSNFDGFPDVTEVKADAHVVAVAPALRHPNVTLLTDAFVERLETDANGRRVAAVVVRHEQQTLRFRGDLVVSSCGAINSAAMMLRSACAAHPHGLANSSGLVGRHYMCHQNGVLVGVFDKPNPSIFQKAFALTDFYHAGAHSPFPLGLVQLMGKIDLDWLRALTAQKLPGVPPETVSHHAIEFFLTSEDLPDPDNRVTLRSDGSIKLAYRRNNAEAYDRLRAKLIELLESCGCNHAMEHEAVYVGDRLNIGGVSHQNGTMRFGHDPRTSVLDVNCKTHDLDNLYVVDSSFFVSSSAVNPSLTIMANALRVGDHLLERLGAWEQRDRPRRVAARLW